MATAEEKENRFAIAKCDLDEAWIVAWNASESAEATAEERN